MNSPQPPVAASRRGQILSNPIVRVGILAAVGVAGCGLAWGRHAAEKTATALAMPAGIIWLLLLVALFARGPVRSGSRFWLFAAWILYTAATSPRVADRLADSLQSPYHDIKPLKIEPLDDLIVLGGGGMQAANEEIQGNTSGDRILVAAQMYHAGLVKRLICTGRRIESLSTTDDPDPAEVSRVLLLRLGVPPDRVVMRGGRNTSEEMVALSEEFSATQTRIGLLTSAWHLPRAMRLAERSGLQVQPIPSDFRTGPRNRPATPAQQVMSFIPDANAFTTNAQLLKEYLAMLVGR